MAVTVEARNRSRTVAPSATITEPAVTVPTVTTPASQAITVPAVTTPVAQAVTAPVVQAVTVPTITAPAARAITVPVVTAVTAPATASTSTTSQTIRRTSRPRTPRTLPVSEVDPETIDLSDSDGDSGEDTYEGVISPLKGTDNQATIQAIIDKVMENHKDTQNPVTVLKVYVDHFLRGRPLNIIDFVTPIEGDVSTLCVNRENGVLKGYLGEVPYLENLRFPLCIAFYGEKAVDGGGPRQEFFRLAIEAVIFKYFSQDKKLTNEALLLQDDQYYYAGLLTALSLIEGGPVIPLLTWCPEILEYAENPPSESVAQFQAGLDKLGLIKLIEANKIVKYLFIKRTKDLNFSILQKCLTPEFSEQGTNSRIIENSLYESFIKYLRETAAGNRSVDLKQILCFVTGSQELPLMGFTPAPSIKFVGVGGGVVFPTASTCTNTLFLPRYTGMTPDDFFWTLDQAFKNCDTFGHM